MTKKELISLATKNSSLDVKVVELALEGLLTAISSGVTANEKVDVKDFGTFKLKTRAARKARNPKTGEQIDVPAKNTVTFKPAKALLEAVK